MADGDAVGNSVPGLYQEFQDCLRQLQADQDYVKTKDKQQYIRKLQQEEREANAAYSAADARYWAASKKHRAADHEYWQAWDKTKSRAGLEHLDLLKNQSWQELEGASAAQDAAKARRDRVSDALSKAGSPSGHDDVEAAVRDKETRLRHIAYAAPQALAAAVNLAREVELRVAAHQNALQSLANAKLNLLKQTMVEVQDASDILSYVIGELTGMVWKYDVVATLLTLPIGLAVKMKLHIYQGLKTVLCSGLLKLAPKLGGLALSEYSTKNATRSFDIAASAPSKQFLDQPVLNYQVLPQYWGSSDVDSQLRRAARKSAAEVKPGGFTELFAKAASKFARRGSHDVYYVMETAYYDMYRADIKVVLHTHAVEHENKCIQDGSALLKDLQAALPGYERQANEIQAAASRLGFAR